MIVGQVTPDREAVIDITVQDAAGMDTSVRTVLDTGFTEYLTLEPGVIRSLALPFLYWMPLLLADGSQVRLEVCEATVVWDGQPRVVPVHATQCDALVGMSMLTGNRLLMDVIDGGPVTITDIP